jgi:hypothetical protein
MALATLIIAALGDALMVPGALTVLMPQRWAYCRRRHTRWLRLIVAGHTIIEFSTGSESERVRRHLDPPKH